MPTILILNVLAFLVLIIQYFTGFFIEPEMQILILTTANGIFRSFVGRDLITGQIKAAVNQPYQFAPVKKIWYSKLFWVSAIGILGAVAQWKFGWIIDPKYYLTIISVVTTSIAAVTKKPVVLK